MSKVTPVHRRPLTLRSASMSREYIPEKSQRKPYPGVHMDSDRGDDRADRGLVRPPRARPDRGGRYRRASTAWTDGTVKDQRASSRSSAMSSLFGTLGASDPLQNLLTPTPPRR